MSRIDSRNARLLGDMPVSKSVGQALRGTIEHANGEMRKREKEERRRARIAAEEERKANEILMAENPSFGMF